MEYKDLKVIEGLCAQYNRALMSKDTATVMKLLALINLEMKKPLRPVAAWRAL